MARDYLDDWRVSCIFLSQRLTSAGNLKLEEGRFLLSAVNNFQKMRRKAPSTGETMIIDHKDKMEVKNLVNYGKVVLCREARAMGQLLFDAYFLCIDKPEDICCGNCQSYVNHVCSGKSLDFDEIVECMVNKAIYGPDYPRQAGSSLKS